jgi:hypothetical protein
VLDSTANAEIKNSPPVSSDTPGGQVPPANAVLLGLRALLTDQSPGPVSESTSVVIVDGAGKVIPELVASSLDMASLKQADVADLKSQPLPATDNAAVRTPRRCKLKLPGGPTELCVRVPLTEDVKASLGHNAASMVVARPAAGLGGLLGDLDQFISHAAQGFDLHIGPCQLRTEMLHVHVHGAGFTSVFVAPDVFEELVARQGNPRVLYKRHQEVELLCAELHHFVVNLCFSPCLINQQVADRNRVLGLSAAFGTPQDRLHTRDHLARVERLRHVIVGANFESNNLVDVIATRRKHQDRYIMIPPDFTADLEPVHAGHHQVQHHHRRLHLLEPRDSIRAVRRGLDSKPFLLEIDGCEVTDILFVINHKNLLRHVTLPTVCKTA